MPATITSNSINLSQDGNPLSHISKKKKIRMRNECDNLINEFFRKEKYNIKKQIDLTITVNKKGSIEVSEFSVDAFNDEKKAAELAEKIFTAVEGVLGSNNKKTASHKTSHPKNRSLIGKVSSHIVVPKNNNQKNSSSKKALEAQHHPSTLRTETAVKHHESTLARMEIDELEKQKVGLENRLADMHNHYKSDLQIIDEEIRNLNLVINDLTQKNGHQGFSLDKAHIQLKINIQQLNEQKQKHDQILTEKDKLIEDLRHEIINIQNNINEHRKKYEKLEQTNNDLVEKHNETLQVLQNYFEYKDDQIIDLNNDVQELYSTIVLQNDFEKELKDKDSQIKDKNDQITTQKDDIEDLYSALLQQSEMLEKQKKSLISTRESFFKSYETLGTKKNEQFVKHQNEVNRLEAEVKVQEENRIQNLSTIVEFGNIMKEKDEQVSRSLVIQEKERLIATKEKEMMITEFKTELLFKDYQIKKLEEEVNSLKTDINEINNDEKEYLLRLTSTHEDQINSLKDFYETALKKKQIEIENIQLDIKKLEQDRNNLSIENNQINENLKESKQLFNQLMPEKIELEQKLKALKESYKTLKQEEQQLLKESIVTQKIIDDQEKIIELQDARKKNLSTSKLSPVAAVGNKELNPIIDMRKTSAPDAMQFMDGPPPKSTKNNQQRIFAYNIVEESPIPIVPKKSGKQITTTPAKLDLDVSGSSTDSPPNPVTRSKHEILNLKEIKLNEMSSLIENPENKSGDISNWKLPAKETSNLKIEEPSSLPVDAGNEYMKKWGASENPSERRALATPTDKINNSLNTPSISSDDHSGDEFDVSSYGNKNSFWNI
jgi:chromosome segregation ATPase